MQKTLTAKTIEKAKPPTKGRYEIRDKMLPGFALRVFYTGRKSWCVVYRIHGRQRRVTIGTYPSLSLAQAREKAREMLGDVQLGK